MVNIFQHENKVYFSSLFNGFAQGKDCKYSNLLIRGLTFVNFIEMSKQRDLVLNLKKIYIYALQINKCHLLLYKS